MMNHIGSLHTLRNTTTKKGMVQRSFIQSAQILVRRSATSRNHRWLTVNGGRRGKRGVQSKSPLYSLPHGASIFQNGER